MAYSTRLDIPNKREISLALALSVVMHVSVIAAFLLVTVAPAMEEPPVSMTVINTFNVAYKAPRSSDRPAPERKEIAEAMETPKPGKMAEPKKIKTPRVVHEKPEDPEKSTLLIKGPVEHAERPEMKGDAKTNFVFFGRAAASMRSAFATDEGRISQTVFINNKAKPVTCSVDKMSEGVVDSRIGCLFAMTLIYQNMVFPRGIPESTSVKLTFEWSDAFFKAINEESVVTVYKDGSISFVDLKASPSGQSDGLNANDVDAPEDASFNRPDIAVAVERS